LLEDKQQETIFYQIDNEGRNEEKMQIIAELFNLIESNKEAINLETYSLSQTTLEQVFLSFAREQKLENEQPKVQPANNSVQNNQSSQGDI
jgi:hypothetical protein